MLNIAVSTLQEAPAVIAKCRPPQAWPKEGLIEFRDYSYVMRACPAIC
jgi:hypothetical protein